MQPEEYIKDRIEDQIKWFERKGNDNKSYFYALSVSQIIFSALIPLLTGLVKEIEYIEYMIGLLGVLIAIVAGLMMIFKFQEKWKQYRTTAEQLIKEKVLYQTKSSIYKNGAADFNKLVTRIEAILTEESNSWRELINIEEKE